MTPFGRLAFPALPPRLVCVNFKSTLYWVANFSNKRACKSLKKRRHHYVWKKYLAPWCVGEKVWCLRNGTILNTNVRNLAVEKDFYKLRDVSKETLDFLRQLADASEFESGRKANHVWIYICTVVFNYRKLGLQTGVSNPEFWRQIDLLIHNAEEDLQMRMESIGGKFLDRMLVGDTEFFEEDNTCVEFCFYLATQMMRTKKMRDSIQSSTVQEESLELGECWYIAAHIFATNFGATLFRDRKTYTLLVLNNVSDLSLITTDQPVFNFRELASEPEEFLDSIYVIYPLSPAKIMLLVPKIWASQRVSHVLQSAEVQRFNAKLVAQSHEQIFAKSEEDLQLYQRAVSS